MKAILSNSYKTYKTTSIKNVTRPHFNISTINTFGAVYSTRVAPLARVF